MPRSLRHGSPKLHPMPGAGDVPLPPGGVHKLLNNNVVVSIDADGRERVLMGRGIGFQLKHDGRIDLAKVEKTFVLDQATDTAHARKLLTDAPYTLVQAVLHAVDEAERELGRDLGRRFPLAVIDHVHYVVERLDQGIRIPGTSMPELRILHPDESRVAEHMAASIAASLGRELPPEEGVFLTRHLLTATRDEPNGTAALLFRRVQHVVRTVETGLGTTLDTDSADYARFILHVRFLLQRLVDRTMLASGDSSFFEFAKQRYPRSFGIAEAVKAYVLAATSSTLTDEEVLYLIVHVERIATSMGRGDAGGDPSAPVL